MIRQEGDRIVWVGRIRGEKEAFFEALYKLRANSLRYLVFPQASTIPPIRLANGMRAGEWTRTADPLRAATQMLQEVARSYVSSTRRGQSEGDESEHRRASLRGADYLTFRLDSHRETLLHMTTSGDRKVRK
jgi:hypothetical protein